MDIEKLIERLRNAAGGPEGIKMCADAATALSTLQAENEKLRSEAEGMRSNWYKSVEEIQKLRAELEQVVQKYETAVKLQVKMTEISNRQMAELEQVKAERDAAIRDVEALMWYSGDGCRICAHGVEVYREPYVRLKCNIEKCQPKWHGHKKED